jgi:hypothetical protein
MTPDDPRRPRPDEPGSGAPTVDELASALLDGALRGADAEAARGRPEVVARAAEMEAARTALRAGVPTPAPSAEARDRALAAALAAFDEADTPARTAPGGTAAAGSRRGEVPDLASRRSGQADPHRHGGRRRGAPRWLGAAAAVVALVAGVAGLAIVSSGGSDDDESAEGGDAAATVQEDAEMDTSDGDSSGDATAAAPEAGGESDDSGGAGGSTPPTTIPAEVGDLGAFPSVDDLVDQVNGLVDGPHGVATPDVATRSSADALDQFGPACAGGLPETLADPEVTLRLHATAVVAGQPVDVWSTEGPDGRRVVVLAADCTVVADRPTG